MLNEQCTQTGLDAHKYFLYKRLSWTAIIAGALVGIGLSFLLNVFSMAIGLSLIRTSAEGATTLAIGGFIGLLIGAVATMFTSGFVAGYLGRPYCSGKQIGVLYGFVSWCVGLILLALLTMPLARYFADYTSFIANAAVAVTHSEPSTMPGAAITSPKTVADLGVGIFLVFTIFLVGAFSACMGGHCGMNSSCHEKGESCH